MKDDVSYFIGEWIEELQDGFVNGMSDVVIFFRENAKVLIEACSGPEMAGMLSAFGTDTMMQYVTLAYSRYQTIKDRIKAESVI
jgi:hypothetical protein